MPEVGVETNQSVPGTGGGSVQTNPIGAHMPGKDSLIEYYRFLNPQDALGKIILPTKRNGTLEPEQAKLAFLHTTYIKSTLPGDEILKQISEKDLPFRGYGYMTVAIDSAGDAKFLDPEYWTINSTMRPPGESSPKIGEEITSAAYYQTICTMNEEPTTPVTINCLRLPLLTEVRNNVDDVSLFFNYIPSHFASQMVPYFDLELQLPQRAGDRIEDEKTHAIVETFLDRPSLMRHLLGSSPNSGDFGVSSPGDLRSVDRLIQSTINVAAAHRVIKNTSEPPAQAGGVPVYITGMEMFTTPQTLTNMEELREDGKNRLNDVKPFLPPASLTSAQITQSPHGPFMTHTANVEIKIHDKARLAEFSEFLRGQAGSADITFWITWGWLAPRGRGDDDLYANFINETMLVRKAFQVKNVSYGFDQMGQVTVKLDLVTKMVQNTEYGRIDTLGSKESSVFVQLPRVLAEIRRLRNSLNGSNAVAREAAGSFPDANGEFPNAGNKEMRIFEIIESAASGDISVADNAKRAEILKAIQAEGLRIEQEKPFNAKADRLLQLLLFVYGWDPNTKGPSLDSKIKAESSSFAKSRFDSFRLMGRDPFLPDDRIVTRDVAVTDENAIAAGFKMEKVDNRIFSEDLVRVMKDYGEEGKPKEKPAVEHRGGGGGGGGYAACPGQGGRNTYNKLGFWWGKYVTQAQTEAKTYQTRSGNLTVKENEERKKKGLNFDQARKYVTVEVPGYGKLTEDQIQKNYAMESEDLGKCFDKHGISRTSDVAVGNSQGGQALAKTAKTGKSGFDNESLNYDKKAEEEREKLYQERLAVAKENQGNNPNAGVANNVAAEDAYYNPGTDPNASAGGGGGSSY